MINLILDIDGVLVTTPSWKLPKILDDGFMEFNKRASENLSFLLSLTEVHFVLSTSHKHHYSITKWIEIFARRAIFPQLISKINNTDVYHTKRITEIVSWIESQDHNIPFLILDDDSSLQSLPSDSKSRWVQTSPLKGFDDEALKQAIGILGLQ